MLISSIKRFLTVKNILWLIILISAVSRFWGLGSADIFHDEGFYAFRAVGYLDYIQNDNQTQPVQWFKNQALPWWTWLSFHDHPPFFFLVQHVFFKIFGDSLFVSRLLSALAGILSVFLVFLIAKKIFQNEYAGLLASFLLAINHIHVWVSRSSLMEPLLIFLIFLNIYLFLRFIDSAEWRGKWWWFFGGTLGLIFLTKYTGFFLIPVYGLYLLIFRRDILKEWQIYASAVLTIIIFSPVIVYNFYLWKTTSHFDLQFAYLFGQNTPEWQVSFGKIQEKFSAIIPNLFSMFSISSLIAAALGIIISVYLRLKKHYKILIFGWLTVIFITLMLVKVGAAYRFITLYSIPLVFFIAIFFIFLWQKIKSKLFFKILLAGFLAYEIFFTVGGIFFEFPDFGTAKLDRYLGEALGGRRSLAVPKSPNPHLDRVIQANLGKYRLYPVPMMIIYDENVILSTRLWVFSRRTFYHGIAAVTVGQFNSFLRAQGPEYFKNYEIYFIKATPHTSLNTYLHTDDAARFENFLNKELNLKPEKIIYGKQNLPMYNVYKFSI